MTTSSRLQSLRAAYSKTNTPQTNRTSNYPFWNMDTDERAVIRFLPDLDQSNPFGFLIENQYHNLTINGRRRRVASLSQWNEECPITQVATEFFNTEGQDSPNGRKYWKKREYMSMVLIVEDPLKPDEVTGEKYTGKVVPISLGPQIHKIIIQAFSDGELESDPDGIGGEDDDPRTWGYDFIIKKTEQGKHNTYQIGTKFANRPRPLTAAEIEAVNAGRVNLTETLRMPKPDLEYVRNMLNADLNGADLSNDPSQPSIPNAVDRVTQNAATTAPTSTDSAPLNTAAEASGADQSSDVQNIIAMMRARKEAE